jgi:hypothetical protein
MRRIPAFVLAVAGLLAAASSSLAQNTPQWPTGTGNQSVPGYVADCLDSLGHAVPPALCDQSPGLTPPLAPATQYQRGQVVSISPNSGAANGFPANAIPTTGVGTGSTGAVTGTMSAIVGKTNYICTAQVSALGGTATIGPIQLTGLKGGNTLTYQITSLAAGNYIVIQFNPCFPASGTNTAISLATTADGSATAVDVNLVGYYQ